MKYKVGDVVKLKSAEELIKLGTWCEQGVEECGGRSYKITDIIENDYWSENFTFDEESIECLVSEAELQKQEEYTFDELKKRVDELKNYLKGYVNDTRSLIMINIETEPNICPCGGDIANVNSLIKIIN